MDDTKAILNETDIIREVLRLVPDDGDFVEVHVESFDISLENERPLICYSITSIEKVER